MRRVLDASTAPAGPDSGGAGRIASAPTPTWPTPARGAAHFLRETVGRVRYGGARGQLTPPRSQESPAAYPLAIPRIAFPHRALRTLCGD